MGKGKQRHDWGIASSLMAQQANINRDRKKQPRPFQPKDFDPTHATGTGKLPAVSIADAAKLLGMESQLVLHPPPAANTAANTTAETENGI